MTIQQSITGIEKRSIQNKTPTTIQTRLQITASKLHLFPLHVRGVLQAQSLLQIWLL